MCVAGNKELANRQSTDGKTVIIKDGSLIGEARERAIREAIQEQLGSNTAPPTGGRRQVSHKRNKGGCVPTAGAGPSIANKTLGPDGSAPGRAH